MKIITKDLLGNSHTILPCGVDDVDVHFSRISDVIPSEEVIQFKQRMSVCIDAGTAYTLSDGSCFLYYHNYKPCCAHGVALYGNNPLKMLALFAGIFKIIDPETFKIDFLLHKGKMISEYKSLLTTVSMRRAHAAERPVSVRVDHLFAKLDRLYKLRDISWEE